MATEEKVDATLELWRIKTVCQKTGVGKSSIWAWVKDGTFPQPRQVGAQAVAWKSLDVLEWMNSRPLADGALPSKRPEAVS